MSKPDLKNMPLPAETDLTESWEQINNEIAKIPQNYLPQLLEIIRLFREVVVDKTDLSAYGNTIALSQLPKAERIQRNQAAIALLNSWGEEGDEQEQKETWEMLNHPLNQKVGAGASYIWV